MDFELIGESVLDFITDRWTELKQLRAADKKIGEWMETEIRPGKNALLIALQGMPEMQGDQIKLLPAAAGCILRQQKELVDLQMTVDALRALGNGKSDDLLSGKPPATPGAAS